MPMTKRDWNYPRVWWALGLTYLALLANLSLSHEAYARPHSEHVPALDKLLHFIAYFLPALGLAQLLHPFYRAIIGLALFGLLMEFLQYAGGPRNLEVSDVLANTLGACAGPWVSVKVGGDWPWRLDRFLKQGNRP